MAFFHICLSFFFRSATRERRSICHGLYSFFLHGIFLPWHFLLIFCMEYFCFAWRIFYFRFDWSSKWPPRLRSAYFVLTWTMTKAVVDCRQTFPFFFVKYAILILDNEDLMRMIASILMDCFCFCMINIRFLRGQTSLDWSLVDVTNAWSYEGFFQHAFSFLDFFFWTVFCTRTFCLSTLGCLGLAIVLCLFLLFCFIFAFDFWSCLCLI